MVAPLLAQRMVGHCRLQLVDEAGVVTEILVGDTVDNVPGDYRRLYSAFAAAIRGEGPAEVTPGQALQLMQLLDAGRRSAREGRTITL